MHKKDIEEKLKTIKDPELDIDIVSLGLVRGVAVDDEKEKGISGAEVTMTLTSPFCPFANELVVAVEDALTELGFEDPRVEITFDPPWEPPEELRKELGV